MKNRILSILCLCLMAMALLCPIGAYAAPLDTDAEASLTLHYQKDGVAFPELSIDIYRVAEAMPDGTYQLIEPFASYPINIHGITQQQQWQTVAATLGAYIVADGVTPTARASTDETGTVSFAGLETGLYFVSEVMGENAEATYIFNGFMVYLPTPQPDGTYLYQVEAKPKCVSYVPKTQYTVTKLWQDSGNSADRPKEVTVQIYKDGVLHDTRVLNADNNWSYNWQVSSEDYSRWTVVETSVSEHYKVTIQQNGTVFSIINTREAKPDIPQTGDSFTPLPWILLLCISGMMLLILGLYGRRKV